MLSLKLIKKQMMAHNAMTTKALAVLLQEDEGTIEYLLDFFIKRGFIEKKKASDSCSKHCQQSCNSGYVFYWRQPKH